MLTPPPGGVFLSKWHNIMKRTLSIGLLSLLILGCSQERTSDQSLDALSEQTERKNVLIIVADDLGYADIESYGGEIPTPNLDTLAENGVTFNRFYTSLTCSPTRSMLLTGGDNHIVGIGSMAETLADNQIGKPGYEGYLNNRMPTIAEILKSAGYHTYMAGKWHLGLEHDQSARAQGFERDFTTLYGAAGHYHDRVGPDAHRDVALYRLNGELLQEDFDEDFYSSKNYTDFLIDSIEENRADAKPFFAYLAYTVPHWPLHVPIEYADKYKGVFNQGWEAIRPERFSRAKELGVIPQSAQMPDYPEDIKRWTEQAPEDRERLVRYMEVYAGMIDYMDEQIGRLLTYLKENGLYENTLVLFISDNGADALQNPAIVDFAQTFDNSLENAGLIGSYVLYEPQWAIAGSAFLSRYKGTAWEGGIRVPAFMSLGSKGQGRRINGMATVLDVLPTVLDYVGVEYPYESIDSELTPSGRSMMPLLDSDAESIRHPEDIYAVEMWGQKAIFRDNWKLMETTLEDGQKYWPLFDVSLDPGETQDLRSEYPEIANELELEWQNYVQANGLVLYDGPVVIRPPGEIPLR